MLSDTLALEASPGELRGAVLAGGGTWEVAHHRAASPGRAGAICLARVTRVDAGLNCAFLETGRGAAVLRARDADPAGGRGGARIGRLTHEGAAIPVRIVADAHGDKAATASAALRLCGRHLAYLPGRPGRVRRAGTAPPPALVTGLDDHEGAEVLVAADAAVLRAELESLRGLWRAASAVIGRADAPVELVPPPPPVSRFLAAHVHAGLERVVVDAATAGVVRDRLQHCPHVDVETVDAPFAELGIDAAIEAALAPRVPLRAGGELVFEPGETLAAVDINSRRRRGRPGRAALDLDLAAMPEIARQLRLRGLGGAIVIDPVRLDAAADRTRVVRALRTALAYDPARCHVLGFSRLGLLEMTRQRRGPALHEILCAPAGTMRPRDDAVAYAALRDLVREARSGRTGRPALRVNAAVAGLLRGPLAEAWNGANAVIGGGAVLETDDGVGDGHRIAAG